MTSTTLQKSHAAMAKFLTRICKQSDESKVPRSRAVQKQYDEAKRLIEQAMAATQRSGK